MAWGTIFPVLFLLFLKLLILGAAYLIAQVAKRVTINLEIYTNKKTKQKISFNHPLFLKNDQQTIHTIKIVLVYINPFTNMADKLIHTTSYRAHHQVTHILLVKEYNKATEHQINFDLTQVMKYVISS